MYLGCCAIFTIYFIDKHIISPIIKIMIIAVKGRFCFQLHFIICVIQRAKSEIDNTLLKDEDFHKYLLYHTKFYFILKRNNSSYFHTLCCKKTFFLSCSKRTSKIGDHIATVNNTVAVELKISGIFLPRNRPTLGHQLQSQNL